jgi:hypothetical protein
MIEIRFGEQRFFVWSYHLFPSEGNDLLGGGRFIEIRFREQTPNAQ